MLPGSRLDDDALNWILVEQPCNDPLLVKGVFHARIREHRRIARKLGDASRLVGWPSYPRDLNLEPSSGVCLLCAVGCPQLSASLPRECASIRSKGRPERTDRGTEDRSASGRCPAPSALRYPAPPYARSASPLSGRRAARARAFVRHELSRRAGSHHARAGELPHRPRRHGRGPGPRRRLTPAGGLPGDVGAIAASPTPFAFKVGVYGVFSTESALRAPGIG